MKDYSSIKIAPKGTHHMDDDQPLYPHRFEQVGKFHAPGLAPARQHGRWFHINEKGEKAYAPSFDRVFGFYYNKAAVALGGKSFHINPKGQAIYPHRYAWCGNYQENVCVVRDQQGSYFHIDEQGIPLYKARYAYVGDFKDHYAVVKRADGKATHIDTQGNYVHGQWFDQLDVFHKGFARAQDDQGWYHIDTLARSCYQQRYQAIEPFYNGVAYAETKQGAQLLINEQGHLVQNIFQPQPDHIAAISGDLVGFWKTYTIYTAVHWGIFDQLPISKTGTNSQGVPIPVENLQRLLRALWELGLVAPKGNEWHITDQGRLLVATSFLADAARMWVDVSEAWKALPHILPQKQDSYRPSFKQTEKDEAKLASYFSAIDGYAAKDLREFAHSLCFEGAQNILGIGRSSLSILSTLASSQPQHTYALADHAAAIQHGKQLADEPIQRITHHPFEALPFSFDQCFLARFLHYFPDRDAMTILEHVRDAMQPGGCIYLLEAVLAIDKPIGYLLDINMMVETSGKERTLTEWRQLCRQANLNLREVVPLSPILSVLTIDHASTV